MTTTTSAPRHRAAVSVLVLRAVIAAVLAAAATFTRDRDAGFGLALLGAFALVQAVPLAAAAVAVAPTREGRFTLGARAALSAVVGVLALLALPGADLAALVALEVLLFLVGGALEVAGGVRRTDGTPVGDAVVVGGLSMLVGAMLIVLDREALLAVGVLAAWGAIVAVYLGIAAASARRAHR